ncbi:hypothetical protein [Nitrosomonas communis]|uniref:hypothetical protein n=1 Tax=Nitrosomonas communis TaxID=44574 RepID=UPI003D266518
MIVFQSLYNSSNFVRDSIVIPSLVALTVFSFSAMASDHGMAGAGRTTIARQAAEWNTDGKPVKLEFDFGDFKAWARRDGSWNAEGTVQHHGLMCGTYTLLLRVGHGNPGCMDVQWFREPVPVASIQLCNNASGMLSGGNLEFRDATRFDDITCAERIISCSGTCK